MVLLLPTWVSAETFSDSALGNSGEVFFARAGTYGELFPEGDELGARRRILVLDISRPGEERQRLNVPTTKDRANESDPSLFYSKAGDALSILWTSRLDDDVSLYLASFKDN